MRSRAFIFACVALVVAALGTAGAQARPDARAAEPGVTSKQVLIGGTVPLTGIAAAYASVGRGAEAYFKYVNSRGGVHGRRIAYRYLDDGYNPANTVQETRKLVQEEQVFAIFNSLGTEHNFAVRPYLNQIKVPQVFPASGATSLGSESGKYPWTTGGFQPSYTAEGAIYGKYLAKRRPGVKVAVLYQNDDYGKNLIGGLKQGLGSKGRIVAQSGHELSETDMTPHIAKLRGSGAKALMIFTTPSFAIRAFIAANKLGWRPLIFLNTVAAATNTVKIIIASTSARAVNGTITLNFLKDPTNPAYRKDKGMQLYRTIMRRFGKGDVNDVYNVYAMASAHAFTTALRRAGKNPTRASLMRALLSMKASHTNPFLLPGVKTSTTSRDRFAIKQGQIQRWGSGRWMPVGGVINARG